MQLELMLCLFGPSCRRQLRAVRFTIIPIGFAVEPALKPGVRRYTSRQWWQLSFYFVCLGNH
jgi:hypothetical protein